jgi:PTS system nitrogen regulatory IIA component
MTLVSKILSVSHVSVALQASSKKRLFEQAGLLFENLDGIAKNLVFDSLFAREKLGSTGLGQGVAIPHGRIKGLKEAAGALVRLKEPIPFEAPDGQNVALIFVLLVPDRATDVHLQILSELAQMFSDRALRERLLAAGSAAELHQLVASWQPNAAAQHSPVV